MSDALTPDVNDAYRQARVLVLGASGFIGRWVAAALSRTGARVTAAVRNSDSFAKTARQWSIRADVRILDASDASALREAISDSAPDIVFNLIGYGVDRSESDQDMMWRINCDLVRQAAVATHEITRRPSWPYPRRFVHVGSALEYGQLEGVAVENRTAEPHTSYGESKLAGTDALRDVAASRGFSAVTARAFTVFGPGEHQGRLLPALRQAARDGTTLRLSAGTQQRDFGYVADVAEGLLRIGVAPVHPGEIVNLASGRLTSVKTFATAAARLLGIPSDRLHFGAEPTRPDEMRISHVDVSRLTTLTGWKLPDEIEPALVRAEEFERRLAGI